MLCAGLSVLLVVGSLFLAPVIEAEEHLQARRLRTWAAGLEVTGVVTAKRRSALIRRRDLDYSYEVGGQTFVGSRVVPHAADFASFDVGGAVLLRVDPEEPAFSVMALDAELGFAARVPGWLMLAVVAMIGCLLGLAAFCSRQLLRSGVAVASSIERISPGRVRVRYVWQGRQLSRRLLVPSHLRDAPVALLVHPLFPRLPLLTTRDSFADYVPTAEEASRLHRQRWREFSLVAAIVPPLLWCALSWQFGEALPGFVQALFASVFLVLFCVFYGFGGDRRKRAD
jgi:hypothetical protein